MATEQARSVAHPSFLHPRYSRRSRIHVPSTGGVSEYSFSRCLLERYG